MTQRWIREGPPEASELGIGSKIQEEQEQPSLISEWWPWRSEEGGTRVARGEETEDGAGCGGTCRSAGVPAWCAQVCGCTGVQVRCGVSQCLLDKGRSWLPWAPLSNQDPSFGWEVAILWAPFRVGDPRALAPLLQSTPPTHCTGWRGGLELEDIFKFDDTIAPEKWLNQGEAAKPTLASSALALRMLMFLTSGVTT